MKLDKQLLAFGLLLVGILVVIVMFRHSYTAHAYYPLRDLLFASRQINYHEIISDCRLRAHQACSSFLIGKGLNKASNFERLDYFLPDDISYRQDEVYVPDKLLNQYNTFLAWPDNAALVGQFQNKLGGGIPTEYYEGIINQSIANDINPELVFTVIQMTTGAITGNFDSYPAILDLGKLTVAEEIGYFTSKLQERHQYYLQIFAQQKKSDLYTRFMYASIEDASRRRDTVAASFAYMDVITQLYKGKPYYEQLIDVGFLNPSSFRNRYFRYALADPRSQRITR